MANQRVMIVGGGLAGVELAAAVADRLRASNAQHPVVLVHSGSAVLPGLRAEQPAVAARADVELAHLGVNVRTGVSVIAVQQNGVELSDGTSLPAAAVLGTIGQRPDSLPGMESLPHDDCGRLVTDPTLLVAPGVWAAGDALGSAIRAADNPLRRMRSGRSRPAGTWAETSLGSPGV